MHDVIVYDLWRGALMTIVTVAAPFVILALVVGLTMSIVQAATQLQENVLSFVPKIVALAATLRFAPSEAPMIVVLRATSGTDTLVAGLSADRRELSIRPLQPVALQSDHSLELWAVPKAGKPASLGLVSARGLTALAKRAVPKDTTTLAVTIEPLGGSPTGQPTGPIVFAGELTL